MNKDNLFNKVALDESKISNQVTGVHVSFWKGAAVSFAKNKGSLIGLIIFSIILLGISFGPSFSPYYDIIDSYEQEAWQAYEENDLETLAASPLSIDSKDENLEQEITEAVDKAKEGVKLGTYSDLDYALLPPRIPLLEKIGIADGNGVYEEKGIPDDVNFFFGTDNLGRDTLVRVSRGAQLSLFIGLVAAIIDILIGMVIGGISGYFGGRFDLYVQRVVDIIASIPTIILLVLISLYMDSAGKGVVMSAIPIILAIAITGWIGMSRLVRAQTLKLKQQEFVLAAETLGGSDIHIIKRHIIPNTIPIIIIVLMFTIPSAIFFEAFLSFLGIGITPPYASLGTLVNSGREYIMTQPYLLVIPSVVLSGIMLSFNMMADGLREAIDPKMRGGGH